MGTFAGRGGEKGNEVREGRWKVRGGRMGERGKEGKETSRLSRGTKV